MNDETLKQIQEDFKKLHNTTVFYVTDCGIQKIRISRIRLMNGMTIIDGDYNLKDCTYDKKEAIEMLQDKLNQRNKYILQESDIEIEDNIIRKIRNKLIIFSEKIFGDDK